MVTGAALGNSRDRQIAEARAHQYRQQQQYHQMALAVTPQDVIAMSSRGLTETVIINHIQSNGVRRELQIADVIALHENGVSEQVISAMQRSRIGPAPRAAPVAAYQAAPPVIVEQYVAPRYHYYTAPRRHFGRRYHRHRSPGIHFSFGH
jgi:hypothetical protein